MLSYKVCIRCWVQLVQIILKVYKMLDQFVINNFEEVKDVEL